MAQANARINVGIDTGSSLAQLRALQAQVNQFNNAVLRSSDSAVAAQRGWNRALADSLVASKNFDVSIVKTSTEIDRFSNRLEKGKLSMGEYFKYGASQVGLFRRTFSNEFDTIGRVAEERVKRLQTQYVSLGKDAQGIARSMAIVPRSLDMTNPNTQMALAGQRMQIFNKLVQDGSTRLLNFGKNTQWAGRQLMVGFTIPLTIFGGLAAKTFMDLEKQTIKFKRVYGDLFTPTAETERALDNIKAIGMEYSKYGIALEETIGVASEAAAAGMQGETLMAGTAQTLRLATLGQIEYAQALETTIAMQNAFKISNQDLASEIDFLNAVENQTIVQIDDLTKAIPRVAPVVRGLGGDVRDLAAFMAAMQEGGVSAEQGANALKSGLASLINPTGTATEKLAEMGINLQGIIDMNKGDLMGTVQSFARALGTLDKFQRTQALEAVFGKFQFARLGALFDNIADSGSQAATVIDLAGKSVQELAALSEKELGVISESTTAKFEAAIEKLKAAIAPIGELFLQIVTPLADVATKVLDWFNELPDGIKKGVAIITVAIAGIAPIALMTFGLLANGIANGVKALNNLRLGLMKMKGFLTGTTVQTQYLANAELEAAGASASLEGRVESLTSSLLIQSGAVRGLIGDLRALASTAAATAAAMPQGFAFPVGRPGRKMATGGFVGGTGNKDSEPALLMPGEFVVTKEAAQKYGPVLAAMNAGTLKGYAKGTQRRATEFAHIGGATQTTIGELIRLLDQFPDAFSQGMQRFIKGVGSTFGEDIAALAFGGLGFETGKTQGGKSINNLMKDFGVNLDDFIQDWDSRGVERWSKSVRAAGLKMDEVQDELAMLDDGIRRYLTSLGKGAKITDEVMEQAYRTSMAQLPAGSRLGGAFGNLQGTAREVRVNITEQEAMARGVPVTSGTRGGRFANIGHRSFRLGGDRTLASKIAGIPRSLFAAARSSMKTQSPSVEAQQMMFDFGKGFEAGAPAAEATARAAGAKVGQAAVQGARSEIPGQMDLFDDATPREEADRRTQAQIRSGGDEVTRESGRFRRTMASVSNKMFGLAMAADVVAMGMYASGMEINEGMQKALFGINALSMLGMMVPMLMNPAGLAIAALAAAAGGLWYLNKVNNDIADKGKILADNMSVAADTLQETADFFGNELLVDRQGMKELVQNLGFNEADMEKINEFVETDLGKKMVEGFTTASAQYGSSSAARDFAANLGTMMLQGAINFDQAKVIAAGLEKQTGQKGIAARVIGSLESIVGPDGKDVLKNPVQLAAEISLLNQQKFERQLDVVETARDKMVKSWQAEDSPWGMDELLEVAPEYVNFVDGTIEKGRELEQSIGDFGASISSIGEQTGDSLQIVAGGIIGFASSIVGAVTGAGESLQSFARGDNWATAAVRGGLAKISPEFEAFLTQNTAFAKMVGNDLRVGWDNVSAATARYNEELKKAQDIDNPEKRKRKLDSLKGEKAQLDSLTDSMLEQQNQAADLMAQMMQNPQVYADGINSMKESITELFAGSGLEGVTAMAMAGIESVQDVEIRANLTVSLASGQLNPGALNRLLALTEDGAADAAFIDLVITERGVKEANDFLTRLASVSNKETIVQIRRVYTERQGPNDNAREIQVKFRVNRREQRRAQQELDRLTKDLMERYDVKDVNLLEKVLGKVDSKALRDLRRAKDNVADLKDEAEDLADLPTPDGMLELAEAADVLASKGIAVPEIDYENLQLSNAEMKQLSQAWMELSELPPNITKMVDTNAMIAAADAGYFGLKWKEIGSFADIAKQLGVEDRFSKAFEAFGITYDQYAKLPNIVKAALLLKADAYVAASVRLNYLADLAANAGPRVIGRVRAQMARAQAELDLLVQQAAKFASTDYSSSGGSTGPSAPPPPGGGPGGGDSGGGGKEENPLKELLKSLKEDLQATADIEKLSGKTPIDVLARLIGAGSDALRKAVKELGKEGNNLLKQIEKIINATGERQLAESLVQKALDLRSAQQKFKLQNVFGLDPEVAQDLTAEQTSYLSDLLAQGGKAAKKAREIIAELNRYNRQARAIGFRQAAIDFVKETNQQMALDRARPTLVAKGLTKEAAEGLDLGQFQILQQLQRDVVAAGNIKNKAQREAALKTANKALADFIKALNEAAESAKKTFKDLRDTVDERKKEAQALTDLLANDVPTEWIQQLQDLGFSLPEIWDIFVSGGKDVDKLGKQAKEAAKALAMIEYGAMTAAERLDERQDVEKEIADLQVQKIEDQALVGFGLDKDGKPLTITRPDGTQIEIDTPERAEREIERIERTQIRPLEREIEGLQENIDDLERANELDERIIEEKEKLIDKVNKQYDDQLEALDKIEQVEQSIFELRQSQLNVASALSRGDIAAAAQAMLDAQRSNAEQQMSDRRSNLEAARTAQIKTIEEEIEIVNGRIEERKKSILNYEDQIYAKEEQIEDIQRGTIRLLEDALDNYDWLLGKGDLILGQLEKQQAAERITNGYHEARIDLLKQQLKLYEDIDKNRPPVETPEPGTGNDPAPEEPDEPESEKGARWRRFLEGYNKLNNTSKNVVRNVVFGGKEPTEAAFNKFTSSKRLLLANLIGDGTLSQPEINELNKVFGGGGAAPNPGSGGGGGGPSPSDWEAFIAGYRKLGESDQAFIKRMFGGQAPGNNKAFWEGLSSKKKTALVNAVSNGNLSPQEKDDLRKMFNIPGLALGGLIPGMGNKDSVLSALMPGEYVINKAATKQFLPLLQAINGAVYPNMSGVSGVMPKNGSAESAGDVYNYSIAVNANTNASADDIANAVITKIKMVEDRKVRGYNY